jgi:uncharacterized delta-60 repeat protein
MKNIYLNLRFLMLSACLIGAIHAGAQTNDSTFNGAGFTYLHDMFQFFPGGQKIQPDGKIIVFGYGGLTNNGFLDGVVYRLNADGTKDLAFGTNGRIILDIDNTFDAFQGVDLQADHKIVLALASFGRTFLVRLLPDGSYDPDFGNEGLAFVDTPQGSTETPQDIHVQADQKIVIGGSNTLLTGHTKGYFRRFNTDGSPDMGFGTEGYVGVDFDPIQDFSLEQFVFQQDGKIVGTGPYGIGVSSGFPVVRLNTDGSFDNTFSGDGKYLKLLGSNIYTAAAYCIAVNPQGKILVGGTGTKVNALAMSVLQLRPDGTLDATFGTFGVGGFALTIFNVVNSMAIQPDGKIILGGYSQVSDTATVCLYARLKANGAQDPTFGAPNGYLATYISTDGYDVDVVTGINLQPDGKLVSTCWSNYSIYDSPTPLPSYATVFRFKTDIVVASTEPNPVFRSAAVFPNPVKDELITLQYQLEDARELSLKLYDANGREVSSLIDREMRGAGVQQEQFYLPVSLPAGNYFLELATDDGRKALQIVKY